MSRTSRDIGLLLPATRHFVRTPGFATSTRAPSRETAKPPRAGTKNCGCSTADPAARTTSSSSPSPGSFREYYSSLRRNREAPPYPTKILRPEIPVLRGTLPFRSFGLPDTQPELEIARLAPD